MLCERIARLTVGFSVLTLVLVTAAGGCGARGEHNREFVKEAKTKIDGLKSGLDWQMAQQQFLAGDLEKALKTVDSSITLNDKVAAAHILRGRIHMERGDLEQARTSLVRATELDEKSAEAVYYLGLVHERFSQRDKALAMYKKAAELDQKNPQYLIAASDMLVEQGELAEADELLAKPPEALAFSHALRHTRGRIAMLRKDYVAAETFLDEARLLNTEDGTVLEDLFRAQLANRRFAQAELTVSTLRKEPGAKDRRDLKTMHAQCLMEMGQLAEARTLLIEVTDQADADRQAWLLLGDLCVRMQDAPRLRQVGNRLVALSPERFEGYLYRAMNLRAANQLDAAIEAAAQATARASGSALPFVYRAMLLKDAGRLEEARSAATHAAQVDPQSRAARQLVELMASTPAVAGVGEQP